MSNKTTIIVSWSLRIIAAIILLQTLFFKFSAHPESVALFTKLGVEPWGRIATGIIELITAILLILPATKAFGALSAAGVMLGAIASHIFVVGIESNSDGGQLFYMAILVLVCSLIVLWMHRSELLIYYRRITGNN
jgi:putative oxidoreductase